MASKKIDIEVELKSQITQAKTDVSSLKKEGVFDSPNGIKNLTKLNGLIQKLESYDLGKLKGPELTRALNEFSKLRSLLDSAARSLTVYTKEFEEQQKVLNDSLKTLNQKKTTKSEKLQAKKDALQSVNLRGHTYFNTSSGKQVQKIETIVDLINSGSLEIRGEKGKKAVSEASYQKVLESTGLRNYMDASKAYEDAKVEVDAQQVVVNSEQSKLDSMPKSGEVHNLTKTIQENSTQAGSLFSDIRDQEDQSQEEDIEKTTKAINEQIPTIDHQTSALGRAFKQFTIYNLAVRSVRTALREAVQTVKELDKYLTEQAMVTGMTREQTYRLMGSYQELALQCGATTKEIASVATEYMKQGKTIQESLTLTQAAVSAAKVARVSVGDSVNYLTTALNGFRLSAEDAMKVSDKFAAVAASSATDYDELAIALSKVASQANLAGMSIDYTTALLTKGLETTREAPETMGTALKTIIARMRELGDYGETLEGDTDLNNVESQLSYVGIALRDQQGELRSTEEVLDELGKKWDTLNKNQQAALAKALAGTRQQSRLIAMMEDYERVTELQEISQRSAGATAAQAGVYLEGIEASINKIQVAWEKIVTGLTNNEVIIGALELIGNILDNIGAALESEFLTLTMLIPLGVAVTSQLLLKWELQKKHNKALLDEEKSKRDQTILDKKTIVARKQSYVYLLKERLENHKLTKEMAKQALLDKDKSDDAVATSILAQAQAEEFKDQAKLKAEIAKIEGEIKQEEFEIKDLNIEQQKTSLEQLANTQGLFSVLGNVLGVLTPIFTVMQLINGAQLLFLKLKNKEPGAYAKSAAAAQKDTAAKSKGMFAGVVSAFSSLSVPGVIAGIALAVGLAAALGVGIAAAFGAFNVKDDSETGAKKINDLSNEIYKLNEKAEAINNITESFDKLDNKLIKTKTDLEEINSLLEKGAESMDDSEVDKKDDIGYGDGKNEKDAYMEMSDDEKKLYLERKETELQSELDAKRQEQKAIIEKMDDDAREKLFNETSTNAEVIKAQSAVYALNNAAIYKEIDALKEAGILTNKAASATEQLTQSMLENITVSDAWEFVQDPSKISKITDKLSKLTTEAKDLNGQMVELSASEVLGSDDYSLKDRVEAYQQIYDELASLGTEFSDVLTGFETEYSGFEVFAKMTDNVIEFIDQVDLSVDEINELYGAWEDLRKAGVNISQKDWQSNFSDYMEMLATTQGDVLAATKAVFGEYLDDSEDALNAFIKAYGDLVQVGVLNMGQNMDKVKNSINNFYDKALEWDKMTEGDRAEFIQDNADLFSGKGGKELLKAFENGNYQEIEIALASNQALKNQIEKRRQEVAQELLIERARDNEDRNEAYIAELERYEEYLNDVENLFKASLEVRLEQEKNQLEEYKSYREKERQALEESLNKRKDAYSKYFDEIREDEEDDEYDQQSGLLISNLSKLGSSSNASAESQRADLENQLKELEAERLKELRERAREAILENIDDEISEMNDKLDKLLESNHALLMAMQGDLANPNKFISDMLTKEISSGKTALEMESYVDSLQTRFGSVLGDKVNWEVLKEEVKQLFLNVNGQTINLNQEDNDIVVKAVETAMTQIGIR